MTARHPREKTLLATIFVLNAIEFLQAGMIAFGAGPIMGEIGASPEEFTLATVVYAVVAIAAISKQGWLVERLGWRSLSSARWWCSWRERPSVAPAMTFTSSWSAAP